VSAEDPTPPADKPYLETPRLDAMMQALVARSFRLNLIAARTTRVAYEIVLQTPDSTGVPPGNDLATCQCPEGTAAAAASDRQPDNADPGLPLLLALLTTAAPEHLHVRSTQQLPPDVMCHYLEEGRTPSLVALIDLKHSHLPELNDLTPDQLAYLATAPTKAQITGDDPTPPPLILQITATADHRGPTIIELAEMIGALRDELTRTVAAAASPTDGLWFELGTVELQVAVTAIRQEAKPGTRVRVLVVAAGANGTADGIAT
jgi:hypothetical protein